MNSRHHIEGHIAPVGKSRVREDCEALKVKAVKLAAKKEPNPFVVELYIFAVFCGTVLGSLLTAAYFLI